MTVDQEDGTVEITSPKGFKQEPRSSGVFCLHPHYCIILCNFYSS